MSALLESPFFGVTITIVAYWIGVKIQQRTKLAICNYMLIAVALLVAVLVIFDIPYESYYVGGSLINLFLGPATACMAVSVYAKLELLKKNWLIKRKWKKPEKHWNKNGEALRGSPYSRPTSLHQ